MSSRGETRGDLAAAVGEARTARQNGRLRAAVEALDRAARLVELSDPIGTRAVAEEGARLGQVLEKKNAPLAALSEYVRALDLAGEVTAAREGVERGVAAYASWMPPVGSVARADQLLVGATGAFWVNRGQKGRVVVLQGGINGETVTPARKALDLAAKDVSWLVLDMKKLVYVGSTGLAAAVKVAEQLEKQGGGLVLFAVASNLAVVIETLGLGRYLITMPDLGSGLARIRKRSPSSAESAIRRTGPVAGHEGLGLSGISGIGPPSS